MSWDRHPMTEDRDGERMNTPEEAPAEAVETDALETVRRESRSVLSEQLQLLNDIDDKAMRSVRTSVLFVGLVVSAVQVSDDPTVLTDLSTWPFRFATGGVFLLMLSILLGVYTYSVSNPEFGVSEDHRNDVVQGGYSHHEWLLLQLTEYDEWTESMSEVNEKNATLLHATLASSVLGVGSLLLSIVWTADVTWNRIVWPALAAVLVVLVPTGVLLLLKPDG